MDSGEIAMFIYSTLEMIFAWSVLNRLVLLGMVIIYSHTGCE